MQNAVIPSWSLWTILHGSSTGGRVPSTDSVLKLSSWKRKAKKILAKFLLWGVWVNILQLTVFTKGNGQAIVSKKPSPIWLSSITGWLCAWNVLPPHGQQTKAIKTANERSVIMIVFFLLFFFFLCLTSTCGILRLRMYLMKMSCSVCCLTR